MIKGSFHQEDITIIVIYAPNKRTLKYLKQKLTELKGEIDHSTIILGNFITPLSIVNRTTIHYWKLGNFCSAS